MNNILINTSNLHGGGAVAVASSFIHELSLIIENGNNLNLLVSSEVAHNLNQKATRVEHFSSFKVIDFYGISALWKGISKEFKGYDIVFTVFGPAYFSFSKQWHIFGFAQPWILYPHNHTIKSFSILTRMKYRLMYMIQSLFFARADELVVELDHVKRGLANYQYLKNIPTHIVHSTIDSVFYCPDKWQPIDFPVTKGKIKLGVIARNYPHKNLSCLPEVKRILNEKYFLDADFLVTFSKDEWDNCPQKFQNEIINIGLLSLDQCPSFYNHIEGVIFPSLLECFSATPLETMTMNKPLFASDLPFIRDCCQKYAHYFDPMSVDDIANTIANYYLDLPEIQNNQLACAKLFADSFSSAKNRALSYLKIITKKQE